jgi:iron complex outermembrane receptor protein
MKKFNASLVTRGAGRGFRRTIATLVAALFSVAWTPALLAQNAPASAPESTELTEIVVTGSMISRPNVETAEAISIITAENLKDMGITTVEQAMEQLSANSTAAYNTASSVTWFSGGGSFANLRGLGRAKTLILLDGQRLANNVTLGDAVDLNVIPFSAIERVEVLREGASSLYGSDAIAGVINFITKKDYDKGEINVNVSHAQQNGGYGDADLTWGKGNLQSDGYNFMISMNYTKTDELRATQRSFAATGYDPAAGLSNTNFPGSWPGLYIDNNGNFWQPGYPACTGNPHLIQLNGSCAYLYSAAVDLVPKSNIASALLAFTKTLPANNSLNLQYFISRAQSTTWSGPQEYAFGMTPQADPTYFPTAANSSCVGSCSTATPDLTDPITTVWTDPNNNRFLENTNTQQRFLVTFSGKNGGWDYATAFDYSQNRNEFGVMGGEANFNLLAPGDTLSNLINPFGPQSTAGQSLINGAYLNGAADYGVLSLFGLNGHGSHELGDAFNAGRAAVLGLGFDTQYQHIDYASTALATTLFPALGFPPQVIAGSRHSQAIFTELNVPVTKDFEFTVSDREDRYSDFGNTNNGKLSLRYQPFSKLTFRAAASTGFRAPSLVNLYQPQTFGAAPGTMDGPGCATGNYTTIFSQANCNAQGLTLQGGNPDLKPETSQNIDLGFIVEPIENLGITLDYYHILIKDQIQKVPAIGLYENPTTFSADYVLNNAGTLSPASELNVQCGGALEYHSPTCGYIIQTFQNTGGITTGGFDLSINYLMHTDVGKFRVGYDGTVVTQYLIQTYEGGPEYNLVAEFNQGLNAIMRYQHLLTLDWTNQNDIWGAGLSNHFLDSYTDYGPNAAGQFYQVGSYSTWNGYVSFKPMAGLTTLAGIRNLAAKTPPFSNQQYTWQAGYNSLYSDPYLRTFYVQLKYDF